MDKRKILSRVASMLLAMILVVSAAVPMAGSDVFAAGSDTSVSAAGVAEQKSAVYDELAYDVTTINGYKTTINKRAAQTAKVSAKIKPAFGRKIRLQRYNSSSKKWETIMTVNAPNAETATVNFSIPKEQRKKTTSLLRIYAPKTYFAPSAKSTKITLITRNIKGYKTTAKAACIYRIDGDGKGTLIYTKNSDTKRAQASTTKLMTAVLLVESGKLDTKTTISAHAAATPWGSGHLAKGDVYKTEDLLYAMLLPSSNDAATAVAEKVGGTEAKFVSKMNSKAKAMGLTKTQFRNPHGLDADGHYTTATELAKLTAYAYTFPEIRNCWATKTKTIKSVNTDKKWTLWSTNAIFGYVSNFLGGKTGTETNSGCCFTGVYKYKGSTYVTVVLGSGYGFSRWSDTKKLHSYIRKYAATKY